MATPHPLFKGSLAAAEAARDTRAYSGFMAGLFEGVVRRSLFTAASIPAMSEDATEFLDTLRLLLVDTVDPEAIDRDGAIVRVFNQRGEYRCKAEVSARARPGVVNGLGVWWRKLGLDGTNVNQLTSQHLTDMGGGPVFYDCLVEVAMDIPAASAAATSESRSA